MYIVIFIFNKHFNKENDCFDEPLKTMPHHWLRLYITFNVVNFLLFKNENLPNELDYHMCRLVN